MDIFNWQRSWGRLQPLFTIWCHLLCCILPFAKYMSGFYPPIDFIHQFPGRLSKHHLPVFLLIHITRQLISLATLQDRPCKHLLYWFCIQPEGLARPTEQIEREDISHIWVPECRYRSRMTHPDVTWGTYDAPGERWTTLEVLGLWSFSPRALLLQPAQLNSSQTGVSNTGAASSKVRSGLFPFKCEYICRAASGDRL